MNLIQWWTTKLVSVATGSDDIFTRIVLTGVWLGITVLCIAVLLLVLSGIVSCFEGKPTRKTVDRIAHALVMASFTVGGISVAMLLLTCLFFPIGSLFAGLGFSCMYAGSKNGKKPVAALVAAIFFFVWAIVLLCVSPGMREAFLGSE